jgi:ABC-type Fe3+ transport system substrate-binding protein
MDYVRMDKMLGHRHAVQLSNRALHPNAGKALIDFFLNDESIRIMAKSGEFVTRKGIYPPLPDAAKIQPVEMDELDAAGFAEKRKEYRKTFFQ